MNPFERVHRLIASGKVIGPDGLWTTRTEALKEKRALLEHVLAGEVAINGRWVRLSDVNNRPPQPEPLRRSTSPAVLPITRTRQEFEKETAVMPPPRFNYAPPPAPAKTASQWNIDTVPSEPVLRNPPPPPPAPVVSPLPLRPTNDAAQSEMPFLEIIERIANTPSRPQEPESFELPHPDLFPFRQEIPLKAPPVEPPAAPQPPAMPPPEMPQPAPPPPVLHEIPRTGQIAAPQPPVADEGAAFIAPLIPDTEPEIIAPIPAPAPAPAPLPREANSARVKNISLGKETSLAVSETRVNNADVALIGVDGFLDQSNSDRFHQYLISMLESGTQFFVVDLGETILVGSAGWGVLAVAARMVKMSGGRLFVCAMKPEIAESFHLLQFDAVIDACTSRQECFDAIGGVVPHQPMVQATIGIASPDLHSEIPAAELPLAEKIRTIISRSGPISLMQIREYLKKDEYGKERIGPIKLYGVLKDLNLERHWKRLRYYRSC